MDKNSVLIVDDDENWCHLLSDLLANNFEVIRAHSQIEALAKLWIQRPAFHLAIIDVRLVDTDPTDEGGLELIRLLNRHGEYTSSIVITAIHSVQLASKAWRTLDISDYFIKGDFENREFKEAVRNAVDKANDKRSHSQSASSDTLSHGNNHLVVNIERSKLYNNLFQHFDYGELAELCFNLGHIEFDDLPGKDRSEKIIELIKFYYRRSILGELLRECYRRRPGTDWI